MRTPAAEFFCRMWCWPIMLIAIFLFGISYGWEEAGFAWILQILTGMKMHLVGLEEGRR